MKTTKWRLTYSLVLAISSIGLFVGFAMVLLGTYSSFSEGDPSLMGDPDQPLLSRVFDYFSYFTIWSNIVVAGVAGVFVFRPRMSSLWFKALWFSSLLMISVTGLIYNIALADLVQAEGAAAVSNLCNHVLTPLAFVLAWLLVGPRGWVSLRVIAAGLVIPFCWIFLTLVRGAFTGAYAYPFVNVTKLGYAEVLTNLSVIVVACCVLSLVLWGIDKVMYKLVGARNESRQDAVSKP